MTAFEITSTVIAVISAIIAIWQATEATKSRKSAESAQIEATESSKRAAQSAEQAAEEQRKIAEAQATISAFTKKLAAANRRNVTLNHEHNHLYFVTNETGETITNVSINATRDDQAAHMHAEPATTLHHGDSLEVLLGYRGQYILCWTDSDGEEQQKKTTANAG
jgi:small-conductance mechanosensitive channel